MSMTPKEQLELKKAHGMIGVMQQWLESQQLLLGSCVARDEIQEATFDKISTKLGKYMLFTRYVALELGMSEEKVNELNELADVEVARYKLGKQAERAEEEDSKDD